MQRYRNPNFEKSSNTNSIGAFLLNAIGPYISQIRSSQEIPDRCKTADLFVQAIDPRPQRYIHRPYSHAMDQKCTTFPLPRFDLYLNSEDRRWYLARILIH